MILVSTYGGNQNRLTKNLPTDKIYDILASSIRDSQNCIYYSLKKDTETPNICFVRPVNGGDIIKTTELSTGLENMEVEELQAKFPFCRKPHSVGTENGLVSTSDSEADRYVIVKIVLDFLFRIYV
jgi:hypothetical protein